jgi:hypothetical protein
MTSEQKRKIDALEQKIRPQIPLYITAMDITSVKFGSLVSYPMDLSSVVPLFF